MRNSEKRSNAALRIIISETQHNNLLNENIQLADKIYFKTEKLSPEDRETILKITGGDNDLQ